MSKRLKAVETRRRQDELRERVLHAGFAAFKELGFHETSTLEIATRAKVSKRELYALFSDKQAIIVECIKWRTQQMQLPLSLPRSSSVQALSSTMVKFGAALMAGICNPEVLLVFRFAVAEAQRTPAIAQAINERGWEPSREIFTDLIRKAQEDNLLQPAPPAEIGEYFFSVLWGNTLLRLLMGLAKLPTGPEMEQRAKRAAERVMAAYGRTAGS